MTHETQEALDNRYAELAQLLRVARMPDTVTIQDGAITVQDGVVTVQDGAIELHWLDRLRVVAPQNRNGVYVVYATKDGNTGVSRVTFSQVLSWFSSDVIRAAYGLGLPSPEIANALPETVERLLRDLLSRRQGAVEDDAAGHVPMSTPRPGIVRGNSAGAIEEHKDPFPARALRLW